MATLAEELLNDFEDEDDEVEEEEHNDDAQSPRDGAATSSAASAPASKAHMSMELDGDEEEPDDGDEEAAAAGNEAEDENEAKARVEKLQLGGISDVGSVANLMKTLEPVLQKVEHYREHPSSSDASHIGNIEDHPEYKLLTQSNTLSTQIDSEIILVHKFIRDHYSTRFPELETLITNPLDYARTVAIIGNGPMSEIQALATSADNLVGLPLRSVIDGPSLMVVTVEATTTRGQELSESELATVRRACTMTLNLDRAKRTLTDYVQSRMTLFAPNLTELIGSLTAAQLLNFAGGVNGLAKTPACNIAPLGSKKSAAATGFSTNVGIRHQGFLYHSDLIRTIPADLRKQAMRIVSAKIVLAARIDAVHSSPSGSAGADLKSQCLQRLDKLTEPPPNKGPRALPVPDEKPARKRGGRRARKEKEATAMTDLRKAQNRMAFGKEEREVGYGSGDSTKGMGMIGMQDTGRIRAQQIDQRTRAKLSKKNPGWGGASTNNASSGLQSSLRGFGSGAMGGGNATSLRAHGLRTAGVSGTASSVAFTPVQGLELVDPRARAERDRKLQADRDRWFKGGTFTQVGGGGGGTTVPGKENAQAADAGFKVPTLPMKRKAGE